MKYHEIFSLSVVSVSEEYSCIKTMMMSCKKKKVSTVMRVSWGEDSNSSDIDFAGF